jgi:hypothetical protein
MAGKLKSFFRGGGGAEEPRLSGHSGPRYDVAARDAFAAVLAKASAVHNAALTLSYTDPATDLAKAVDVASLYCNDELLRRMHTFRDAVLEASMSVQPEMDVEAARDAFTQGCRLALGTND